MGRWQLLRHKVEGQILEFLDCGKEWDIGFYLRKMVIFSVVGIMWIFRHLYKI